MKKTSMSHRKRNKCARVNAKRKAKLRRTRLRRLHGAEIERGPGREPRENHRRQRIEVQGNRPHEDAQRLLHLERAEDTEDQSTPGVERD